MNKKTDELFSNVSDEQIEKIAADYPTWSKKQRDRIFREIERRVSADNSHADEVRGVEVRRSRTYLRIISAAAAFVIIAGAAVGGGYVLLRQKGRTVPNEQVSETDIVTTELLTDTAEEPVQVTETDLLNLINSASYDKYDRISMDISLETNNEETTSHHTVKIDNITGNKSYIDSDFYPLENGYLDYEYYFYKDLIIEVNGGELNRFAGQYNIYDRENCRFDNIGTYTEHIIEDINFGRYEIQEITSGVQFNSMDCISAKLFCPSEAEYAIKAANDLSSNPCIFLNFDEDELERAKEELGLTNIGINDDEYAQLWEQIKKDRERLGINDTSQMDILVDTETGFIVNLDWSSGDENKTYTVDKLCLNDEAELPEDGEYIKNRIAECTPCDERTAAYDLSVLDE